MLIDPINDCKDNLIPHFLFERYFIILILELQRSFNSSTIGLNIPIFLTIKKIGDDAFGILTLFKSFRISFEFKFYISPSDKKNK
ncbi:hypothetical protein BpHYR1_008460 [Brachionus plicatilis]|uniref:Uncharacterized protein n=1 Tax=Brachionus plicatilis TaxID=10195 RepID=A0A3M7QK32_BRAPC|nr:hypothetical protein BpHYR1_008460 [Brachionus plicatilis]